MLEISGYVKYFLVTFNNFKMSESQTKAGNQECFEKLEKLSLSLLTLLSLLSLLSISHSITLDMLNKFCFHVHAQKSLFIGENANVGFLPNHRPVSLEFLELCPS